MPRLAATELDTVTRFLSERLEPEDLKQVVEILVRNTDVDLGADDLESETTGINKMPRNGIEHVGGAAMDARRAFEKQHAIQPRKIRNLG